MEAINSAATTESEGAVSPLRPSRLTLLPRSSTAVEMKVAETVGKRSSTPGTSSGQRPHAVEEDILMCSMDSSRSSQGGRLKMIKHLHNKPVSKREVVLVYDFNFLRSKVVGTHCTLPHTGESEPEVNPLETIITK